MELEKASQVILPSNLVSNRAPCESRPRFRWHQVTPLVQVKYKDLCPDPIQLSSMSLVIAIILPRWKLIR